MSERTDEIDLIVPSWSTLPDAAERLGTDAGRVRQLVRDRQVLAVRRPVEAASPDGGHRTVLCVPSDFIQDGHVLKGLPGLLTVLADAGFSDDEALRWLFSADDALPGTPVQALRENRGREVRRRAQALAF